MPRGNPTHEHDELGRHNISKKHIMDSKIMTETHGIATSKEDKSKHILNDYTVKLENQFLETQGIDKISPTVSITKLNPVAKVQENSLGLDLFLLSDIELHNGLTTLAKTGITIEIPDDYFGMITLDDEIASNGAIMVGSPKYVYGKQEISFYVTAMVGNYFEFRKERKIAQIIFYKKENVNYEYK